MLFQSLLSLALVAVVVSAQSTNSTTNSTTGFTPSTPQCNTCMDNALDSLPPCKGVDMNSTNVNNITDPSQLSPAYKNCICTMVSSTNWFASCFSTPGGCSNEWLSDITSGFAIIQSQVCVGFKASNEGGAMANANLALTVMGITVALAGMVTHALLYL